MTLWAIGSIFQWLMTRVLLFWRWRIHKTYSQLMIVARTQVLVRRPSTLLRLNLSGYVSRLSWASIVVLESFLGHLIGESLVRIANAKMTTGPGGIDVGGIFVLRSKSLLISLIKPTNRNLLKKSAKKRCFRGSFGWRAVISRLPLKQYLENAWLYPLWRLFTH